MNICILHLSLIDGVGSVAIKTIQDRLPDSYTWLDLYQMRQSDFTTLFGLSHAMAEKIYLGLQDKALLEQECTLIERHAIRWMTIDDPAYPTLLAHIYAPPAVLYWRGADLDDEQQCIAVIGSRKANYYGQRVVNQLVPELVNHGFTIVSGGALGLDTMAHQATVAAGGKTIVVLGSGLLQPYPHRNKALFDTIVAKGGTIVSSFPLLMEALPGNFPARNRIVSGLSKGCLVVQAAHKSGASITAHYALEQGREVFAVPGPIDDELSGGCHALIQQGATLVSKPQDILDVFVAGMPRASVETQSHEQQQLSFSDDGLDDNSRLILQACRIPCATEELMPKTGLSLPVVQETLFSLQLDGRIESDVAGMWNVL